jgi:hypothetical protein
MRTGKRGTVTPQLKIYTILQFTVRYFHFDARKVEPFQQKKILGTENGYSEDLLLVEI